MATGLLQKHSSEPNIHAAFIEEVSPTITLAIANVGRGSKPTEVKDFTKKKKIMISRFLRAFRPSIVLFQEFKWKGIVQSHWGKATIPPNYEHTGDKDRGCCILFDKNELIVEDPGTKLQTLLDEMLDKNQLPTGFTLPRMWLRVIKTKGCPDVKFICVSWHGQYKTNEENRLMELENFIKFIRKFGLQNDLAFLIGGDFNISLQKAKILENLNTEVCDEDKKKEIEKYGRCQEKIVFQEYETFRRKGDNILDFYIVSESLQLNEMHVVNWKHIGQSKESLEIFDHDPVSTKITQQKLKKHRRGSSLDRTDFC